MREENSPAERPRPSIGIMIGSFHTDYSRLLVRAICLTLRGEADCTIYQGFDASRFLTLDPYVNENYEDEEYHDFFADGYNVNVIGGSYTNLVGANERNAAVKAGGRKRDAPVPSGGALGLAEVVEAENGAVVEGLRGRVWMLGIYDGACGAARRRYAHLDFVRALAQEFLHLEAPAAELVIGLAGEPAVHKDLCRRVDRLEGQVKGAAAQQFGRHVEFPREGPVLVRDPLDRQFVAAPVGVGDTAGGLECRIVVAGNGAGNGLGFVRLAETPGAVK